MPDCEYYEKGNCFKDNCLYRHVKFNEDTLQCEKFQKGFCPLGTNCSLRHIYKTSLNESKRDKNDHIKAVKINKKDDLKYHKFTPLLGKGTSDDSSSVNSDGKSDGTTKVPCIKGNVDHVKQCDADQSDLDIEQTQCPESNMSQVSTIQSNKDHIQETDLFIPFTEHSSRSISDLDYISFSSSAMRKGGRPDSDGNNDENRIESGHEDDSDDNDDDDDGDDKDDDGNDQHDDDDDSDGNVDGSDGDDSDDNDDDDDGDDKDDDGNDQHDDDDDVNDQHDDDDDSDGNVDGSDGDSVENGGVVIEDGSIEVDGMEDIDNEGRKEGESLDDYRRQDGEDGDDGKQEREDVVELMGGSHEIRSERGFHDGVDEVNTKQDNDMITLSNEQNSYEEEIDNEAEGVTTSMEYQTQLTEELRNANMLQYVPRFLITQKDPFAFIKCKA
eukprot:CAMPEP_0119053066 /NCGR_PEP_ID=MMETSP1177-20130426/74170_1 /TAXON_ID=2985 /ORGANISM="Ochromonas sp, Strain CCMP1899" /LENGTH=440 /DNA_ID=CAMNT_0007032879 /DNA_START=162 /DNA_END=1484 /DNA_ORIENTATION=+